MNGNSHFKHTLLAICVAAGASYNLTTASPTEPEITVAENVVSKSDRKTFAIDITGADPKIVEMPSQKQTKKIDVVQKDNVQVASTGTPLRPIPDPEFRTERPVIEEYKPFRMKAEKPDHAIDPVSRQPEIDRTETTTPEKTRLKSTVDYQSFVIKSGQSLSSLFRQAGFNDSIMYKVIHGAGEADSVQKIYPGETITFGTKDGELVSVSLERNPIKTLVIKKEEEGYLGVYEEITPDVSQKVVKGVIEDSLYLSAKRAGLTDKTIMEMADLFGWDIDFVYDIRKGDRFEVVYEEKHVDGEFLETGKILAARFINQGEEHVGLYYPGEDADYYTPEGKSMKKAFLRTPINARVSSPFNLQRRHPVLDIVRPHEGIDYAAPVGTPIKASGSGKVIFAGRKGGYGRTVIIKHGGNITTLYAHMKGIKNGIRTGVKVKQGETVGYLGSSGMVTGPHLHYEFRVAGVPKNPKTVNLPDAKPLPSSKLADFHAKTRPWQQMLGSTMLANNAL